MHDLDDVLKELGQFGRYQMAAHALIFFPLVTFAFSSMSYVFTTADIDYRCVVPECENYDTEIYEQPWLQNAIPFNDGGLVNHCLRYKALSNSSYETCSSSIFSKETEECERFVFGKDIHTITKDIDLLCERNDWKRLLVGTVGNFGMVTSMPVAGVLADRFGRKTMVVWCLILTGMFGIIRSFSTTFLQFIICETLDAIVHSGLFNAAYVFGAEIVGPDMRGLSGVLNNIYYSIGEILLCVSVWFFKDWRIYLKVLYIPAMTLGVLFIWIFPESVRWLIIHGKKEKVKETINMIAGWNKKTLSTEMIHSIEDICSVVQNTEPSETGANEEKKVKTHFIDLLKSRTVMLRVLNCSYCWFANSVVYFGLSVHSTNISDDKYLTFILVCAAEIPGCILCYFLVRHGRKLPLILGQIVSGIACLAFHFVPQGSSISLAIYFIGKMAITESAPAIMTLASEFFPTDFRNTLFGICSTIGLIGAITAPQVSLVAKYVDPVLVFSAFTFSAAALALFLPETSTCAMPDSLEEAENIAKK